MRFRSFAAAIASFAALLAFSTAEAAEISPAFRKEVEANVKRTADLVAPLLEGNRTVWKTQLGIARYIGGPKDS